jgi:hypothetical protein
MAFVAAVQLLFATVLVVEVGAELLEDCSKTRQAASR